jgi:hypothetical protein
MTVAQLKNTMDIDEFNGWQAWYALKAEEDRNRDG